MHKKQKEGPAKREDAFEKKAEGGAREAGAAAGTEKGWKDIL